MFSDRPDFPVAYDVAIKDLLQQLKARQTE